MTHRILGIVGWLGVALIFAATIVRFVRPEWDQYVIYGVRAGLVAVVLYTLGQWRDILAFFGTRNARHGAVAGAGVLITLGLLVAVNYLSTRRNTRWDLTENQQFSLSDQTLRLLQSLETPVTFLVFDQEGGFDRFRARLDEYAYQSDQVRVEYIDADRQPARARQYQVQAYGTVVIEHDGRVERVTSETEQDLTNGLIRVLSDAPRKVYFAQGHGERTTTDTERTGYSSLATLLSRDNYIVDLTTLAQQAEVPADASVVVLAGPKTDLLPGEADMLRRYLDTGGDLLVLLDPPESDGAAVRMPVLEALLREWSIEVGNDVVVDASGVGQLIGTDASVPVAASYPAHPITDRFNVLTAYPFARSVNVAAEPAPGRTPQAIIETGPRSWAETSIELLESQGETALDAERGDRQGPITIGLAVSAPAPAAPASTPPAEGAEGTAGNEADAPAAPESRVVVVGDSDFVANYALGIQGNGDLFMNAVNWLAQQENLIAIRPRDPTDRRVTLTASQTLGVFLLSIVVVPATVFGAGIYAWWRRRQ